jgi:hypothetical protein
LVKANEVRLQPRRDNKHSLAVKIQDQLNSKAWKKGHPDAKWAVEKALTPWVMTNLLSFPELAAEPFVFAEMMPVSTQCPSVYNTSDECSRLQTLFWIVAVTQAS